MADAEFFACQCHTDAIRVSSFDDGDIYVEFWTFGSPMWRPPLRQRLKLFFKILRGKGPSYEVCLSTDEAGRLADFIRARVDAVAP